MILENNEAKAQEAIKKGDTITNFVVYGGDFFVKYLKLVVMTYQPLNTCKSMCSSLNPKVKSIVRHTATTKIDEIAARVKASLEIELKHQYFARTCDRRTSIAGTSYVATTVHYINDDWELVSFTLSCKEHTGTSKVDDVLRVLKDAWVAYKLDTNHIVGVVTDTAPVMGAFGRKLPDNVLYLTYIA